MNCTRFAYTSSLTERASLLNYANRHKTKLLHEIHTKIKSLKTRLVDGYHKEDISNNPNFFNHKQWNQIACQQHLASPTFQAQITACRHLHFRRNEIGFPSVSNVAYFHRTRLSCSMANDGETSTQLVKLARKILKETGKVDVMAGSIPQSTVVKLIEDLHTLGFDQGPVRKLLSGKLWLLQQTEATLTLCQLLLDHGLTPQLICRVVESMPLAHQRGIGVVHDKINEMLLFFRTFGFHEGEIFNLLDRDASVLFLEKESVQQSIEMVKSYFPASLTKKIVCTSPNVLYDDWFLTHDKFNYCIYMMGYNQHDIVRSCLFSHSLHHIKDRHIFLQRAGVFQVVNKKLHPSLNVNPFLNRVVDSSNSSFVKLVDGITVEDYRVYKKMREIERQNAGEEDDNGEEEEDDDGESVNSEMESSFELEK